MLSKRKNSSEDTRGKEGIPHDRRSFLQKLGLGSMILGISGFAYQSLRSLVPNVLYEPARRFKIGLPEKLAEGMTFLEDRKLYLFREGKSFYAISAVCTHLGCTVKYTKLQKKKQVEVDGLRKEMPFEFHCPCHGSKFYADGTNYAGPAPRPLRWYKLAIAPDDGKILVDMREEVDRNFRLTV